MENDRPPGTLASERLDRIPGTVADFSELAAKTLSPALDPLEFVNAPPPAGGRLMPARSPNDISPKRQF
jgi:hypothetical protein